MQVNEKCRLQIRYALTDWITTSAAFLLFDIFRYYTLEVPKLDCDTLFNYLTTTKMIAEQVFIPLLLLGIYWLSGYYNNPFQRSRLQEFNTTILSALFDAMLIYLGLLTNDQIELSSDNYFIIAFLFLLLAVFTYAGRLTITTIRLNQVIRKRLKFRTLIVGSPRKAKIQTAKLRSSLSELGYSVEGYIFPDSDITGEFMGQPVCPLDSAEKICREKNISQVILTLEHNTDKELLRYLNIFYPLNVAVKISPDLTAFITSGIRLQDIYGEPFVDLTVPQLRDSTKNIKRTIDVVASVICLIIILIPMLIIAIRIRLTDGGPVLYKQQRLGIHQKPFNIYKFRTMRTDAEKNGPALSSDNDTRITNIGKVLRKYRLDELPQFWNVFKGDMSLVGPRPEREFFVKQIVKKAPYYTLLYQVQPGITSWGMVKYGYASDVDQMIERSKYDLIYLSNMSLAIDLKILIYTIRTVALGKGK